MPLVRGHWQRVAVLVGVVILVGLVIALAFGPPGFFRTSAPSRPRVAASRAPAPSTPTPEATAPPVTAATTVTRLGPDASGRIRIPLTDARVVRLPIEGVPSGWYVKEFAGRANVDLVRDEGRIALQLSS